MRMLAGWTLLVLAAGCASAPTRVAIVEQGPQAAPMRMRLAWGTDVDLRRPLSPPGVSTPAVIGDMIVLGARDRRVHVLDLRGSERRLIALEAACESGALALTPHLVVLGDVAGTVYGIDPQGGIVWRRRLSAPMLGRPVRALGGFFVQTADNQIYRFSTAGKKQWSYADQAAGGLSMHHGPSPLVAGKRVFAVFSNGDVVALKSDSGELIWRRQLLLNANAVVLDELKTPVADPVLVGRVLIVSFYQGEIMALSAVNGQQLWQRKISLRSTPLIAGGRLIVATASGSVMEIDVESGATLWQQRLHAGEMVGPLLYSQRLLAADAHGHVYVLTLDGHRTAEMGLPGRIDRAPTPTPAGVLVRNDLGGLYMLKLR